MTGFFNAQGFLTAMRQVGADSAQLEIVLLTDILFDNVKLLDLL